MKTKFKLVEEEKIRMPKIPDTEELVQRQSYMYKEWREAVNDRDQSRCQECGRQGINAHHIKYFSNNPDGRFDVFNGVLLCSPCHKAIHKLNDGEKDERIFDNLQLERQKGYHQDKLSSIWKDLDN